MTMKIIRSMLAALAAFFIVSTAHAQGTVANHAIPIGKGAGVTGFSSALCTSAQLLVGQTSADPLCKTITGDVTLTAAGVTALTKITLGSDADGDIYYRSGGVLVRLPISTNGKVLGIAAGLPSWLAGSSASSVTDASTAISSGTNDTLLLNNSGTLGHTAYTNTTLASVVDKINTVKANFYVATSGTDTGDCTNIGSPCATINYAVQQSKKSNAGNFQQQINLAAGTYHEDVTVSGHSYNAGTSCCAFELIISGAGPASTIWDTNSTVACGVLTANFGGNVAIQQLTIKDTGSTTCKSLLFANLGGFISVLQSVTFGQVHQSHLYCEEAASQVIVWNSITVLGGYTAKSIAQANTGCTLIFINSTITFSTGTLTVSFGGMEAHDNAVIYLASFGTINAALGPRFYVDDGLIVTNGFGCTSIPGSSAGVASGINTYGKCK